MSTRGLSTRSISSREITNVKNVSSALTAQGIKHGVVQVERSHFVDEDGELHEDQIFWREERRHFKSNFLEKISGCLVWLKLIPDEPDEMWTVTHGVLLMLWAELICDLGAAITAVMEYEDVTYCCGEPILGFVGDINWKKTVRIATYVFVGMVILEFYPVIQRSVPINVINPVFGFSITVSMFFGDTVQEAITLWIVESTAVICEVVQWRLKVIEARRREIQLKEVGLKTKKARKAREDEDPDAPQRELTDMRRKYYQLKNQTTHNKTFLFWAGLGCYMNMTLCVSVLALVITVKNHGGLCVSNHRPPNPFARNQIGRCTLCNSTEENCEICYGNITQCFFSYS